MALQEEKVMTNEDVIEFLKLKNIGSLNWACSIKGLPHLKIGKKRTFLKSSVIQWTKEQEVSNGL